MIDKYRVLSVNFVDITVFTIACLEVGVDMRKIVSSFSSDTGLNDALVHGFVCRRNIE